MNIFTKILLMKHLIAGILLVFSFVSYSQNDYLVTIQGDSLSGDINITQGPYYDEVKIKSGKQKELYKAYQLSIVSKDGELYETINYINRKVMAKILSKGTLSLYAVRPLDKSQYTERVFYKDGKALGLSSIGFRGSTMEFLKDCEFLFLKLDDRTYSYNDIDEVVRVYNEKCGNASKKQSPAEPVMAEVPQKISDYKQLINLSQLLLDVTTKLEKDEEVPTYMIEALEKYSDVSIDSKVQELLKTLKEN